MREEKRWPRHGEMATAFFLLAAKFMCAPDAIRAKQNTSSTRRNIQQLEPQNIRESTLDFTAHLGEINPDMLYICRRGLSGPQKAVFAFFPSVRRGTMKNVKSSIFGEKTSKFLSLLSFKP